MIRLARPADCAAIRVVEQLAGQRFLAVGMADIAADDPPGETELLAYVDAGRAWVATDADDGAVGYALGDPVDAFVHVAQLSVAPAHAGRGLGRRLLAEAQAWAAHCGSEALTLTTFAEVAWNAPYYARLGFGLIAPSELTPGLAAIVARESELGLDRWARVCMRRDHGATAPATQRR